MKHSIWTGAARSSIPILYFADPAASDGGEGGVATPAAGAGGGAPAAQKTFTQAELDAHVAGLRTKNAELIAREKVARERALPEGMTAEEAADAIAERRKAVEKRALDEGKFDEARLAIKADADKRVAEEIAKRTAVETRYQTTVKKTEAVAAISAEKGNATLLLPHVLGNLGVVHNDTTGEDEVIVIDPATKKPALGGDGKPLTPRQFVASLKNVDDYLGAFDATAASGGGARGGGGGRVGSDGEMIIPKGATVQEYRRIKAEAEKRNIGYRVEA